MQVRLTDADFLPADPSEREQIARMRESVTYWKDAMRRFRQNKVAMVSLILVVIIALAAIFGPLVLPYQFDQQTRGHEFQRPSFEHPLGTDQLGRDMLVRVLVGTRISLAIGIIASVIILLIGTMYGAISGFFGGWVDNIMMRICEILYAVPTILIVILLSVVVKDPIKVFFQNHESIKHMASYAPGLLSIFVTFGLLYWVGMARIVRGQILSLRNLEYITAARAFGASSRSIILRHLLPNCIGPIVVTTMLQIPSAIFTESFLSFIGLGISAPMASLGSLASDAINSIYSYPYLLVSPAVAISLIILAFNQFGDGLRDALDPRLRNG